MHFANWLLVLALGSGTITVHFTLLYNVGTELVANFSQLNYRLFYHIPKEFQKIYKELPTLLSM